MGGGVRPQSKMYRAGAGRSVTRSSGLVVVLGAALGHHFDSCSDPIAVTLGSLEFELQPMVGTGALVHPNFCWGFERSYDYIHAPIAIQVADGRSSVSCWRE